MHIQPTFSNIPFKSTHTKTMMSISDRWNAKLRAMRDFTVTVCSHFVWVGIMLEQYAWWDGCLLGLLSNKFDRPASQNVTKLMLKQLPAASV